MERVIAGAGGLLLVFFVLLDTFETMVLPRRVTQRIRLSRLFYRATWAPWSAMARRVGAGSRREGFLSTYGPLSLLMLLVLWIFSLMLGFALLQFAIGSRFDAPVTNTDFFTDLYVSGTTLFTLGLGDFTPTSFGSRVLMVIESGLGFGFFALVIAYLPALNQAFSDREVSVSLLDERAGSPPSAFELLRRHCRDEHDSAGIQPILHDWERWSAELLESHLSYPVLGFFRSQHDNQSWVAALTMILDSSALVISGVRGVSPRQAQLTFAMARHTVVDLAQVYNLEPRQPEEDRLPPDELALLRSALAADGVLLSDGPEADKQLARLRALYEPYIVALSRHLLMPLPAWLPPAGVPDDWQTSDADEVAEPSQEQTGSAHPH